MVGLGGLLLFLLVEGAAGSLSVGVGSMVVVMECFG